MGARRLKEGRMETISFKLRNGEDHPIRLWLPEGTPRCVVQIVHGMAEHIDRYERLALFLNAHGIAAAGINLAGHGAEAGTLGWFAEKDGWAMVLHDIDRVRAVLAQRLKGVPYVLMGHSMGSFLVRCYLAAYPAPDLAVLSGTGTYPAGLCGFGQGLSALCSLFGGKKPSKTVSAIAFSANNKPFLPARTAFDWLSRDEKEVDKYVSDPYCGFLFTAKAYQDFFGGLKSIAADAHLKAFPKDTPLYLMSGGADPVGQMGEGVRQAAERYRAAGCKDVTVKLYEGARHELLNETNRDDVMNDFVNWLLSRLKG